LPDREVQLVSAPGLHPERFFIRVFTMNTPHSVFDESIGRWVTENELAWMKLKTEIGLGNRKKHLPQKTLPILDAGGGSGADSILRGGQR
jgi:hypothetical protein